MSLEYTPAKIFHPIHFSQVNLKKGILNMTGLVRDVHVIQSVQHDL